MRTPVFSQSCPQLPGLFFPPAPLRPLLYLLVCKLCPTLGPGPRHVMSVAKTQFQPLQRELRSSVHLSNLEPPRHPYRISLLPLVSFAPPGLCSDHDAPRATLPHLNTPSCKHVMFTESWLPGSQGPFSLWPVPFTGDTDCPPRVLGYWKLWCLLALVSFL